MSFAFVFPGQGSQSVGMMAPFEAHAAVRRTFDEASATIGIDLWAMVRDGPDEELMKTVNTQPLMLTAGIALFRAWSDVGGAQPAVMAGHSLGEYTALVAAGVMTLVEAVPLVRFRAQAMQEAVPEGTGAMAAVVGLDDDGVRAACQEAAGAGVAEAANFNFPGQVVIAGEVPGVQRAMELAKARGAKRAVLLPMSAPSHCSLMRPASDRLRELLLAIDLKAPAIPVLNNVDVAIETTPERIRDALLRQLYSPVRWSECVTAIAARGVPLIIECGPGAVLTGINKRITPAVQPEGFKTVAMSDAETLRELAGGTGSAS